MGRVVPASTTAAGLARRFGPAQLAGIESAISRINARVLGLVPRVRRSALERQVTIDIDATDIEVYGGPATPDDPHRPNWHEAITVSSSPAETPRSRSLTAPIAASSSAVIASLSSSSATATSPA